MGFTDADFTQRDDKVALLRMLRENLEHIKAGTLDTVSCDSWVSQATHGQWLKGDPGFWRDNVLGSDRCAISRCHQVKSLGFPPRTTVSTTNHTKSVELVGSWQVALERVLLERPDRPDHAGTCQW